MLISFGLGGNERLVGTSISFWFSRKIIFEKFLNLKFWQILKEKIVKLLKTVKLALVNFEGCPCKTCKSFGLGHLEIWVEIWFWKYYQKNNLKKHWK